MMGLLSLMSNLDPVAPLDEISLIYKMRCYREAVSATFRVLEF